MRMSLLAATALLLVPMAASLAQSTGAMQPGSTPNGVTPPMTTTIPATDNPTAPSATMPANPASPADVTDGTPGNMTNMGDMKGMDMSKKKNKRPH